MSAVVPAPPPRSALIRAFRVYADCRIQQPVEEIMYHYRRES